MADGSRGTPRAGRGGRTKSGKPRVGTGGYGRRKLEGKGPTPPAHMRPGHPAQRRAAAATAAAKRAGKRGPGAEPVDDGTSRPSAAGRSGGAGRADGAGRSGAAGRTGGAG